MDGRGGRLLVVLALVGLLGVYAWRVPQAAGCAAGTGWAATAQARFAGVLARAAVLDPALGPTAEVRAFAAELQRVVAAQQTSAPAPADRFLNAALTGFYGRLRAYWAVAARGGRLPGDALLRDAGQRVESLAAALAARCRGDEAAGQPWGPSAPTSSVRGRER